ncbi:hypothetical protein LCGC14_1964740 [marine sediment metagenome]|uniref:Uncharacterized protein n=1 Tax=marine sediment metagenome TaxID=412755 RepID=A0A0F9FDG8_9ZZZZ
MKTPYDDDIAAMERKSSAVKSFHWEHSMASLKGKRQGWLDAHEKLLPLLRGMLEIARYYGGSDLEDKALEEHLAIIKQVEEVVKGEGTPGPTR